MNLFYFKSVLCFYARPCFPSSTRGRKMIGLFVSILSLICAAHSFPNGAPKMACSSMTPVHPGFAAQEEESPYFLEVSSTSVNSLRSSDISADGKLPNTKAPLTVQGKNQILTRLMYNLRINNRFNLTVALN